MFLCLLQYLKTHYGVQQSFVGTMMKRNVRCIDHLENVIPYFRSTGKEKLIEE